MASIVWNTFERAVIDVVLGGVSTAYTPSGESVAFVPAAGGNWGLGLGTRANGVGSNKADRMATIIEIGTTTAAGYARKSITRDNTGTGWPLSTKPGSSYQSTPTVLTFSFTGAPTPNGATLWFVAGSTTLNADNALFGADLSATRTYGNGDQEAVTPTFMES